jgi:hypothetical protein
LRHPTRLRLHAADGHAWLDHHALPETIGCDCHGQCKIAGAAVELVKAAMGIRRQERQAHFREELILLERRAHDALKKLPRRDDARPGRAPRHHFPIQRRDDQTPFGCGVGMGNAAAECPAGAYGIMRDVLHHVRKQAPERSFDHRLVKRGVTNTGPNAQLAALDHKPFERRHPVDVDEVRGPREPERHDGNEALSAGQNAPILPRYLRQGFNRLLDGFGCVIAKGGWLHCSSSSPKAIVVRDLRAAFLIDA